MFSGDFRLVGPSGPKVTSEECGMNAHTVSLRYLKRLCLASLLLIPPMGWSAVISDQPLFVAANVDHNLMYVIDDSGSMDFEVLGPAIGAVGAATSGYIFDPGYNTNKYDTGKRLIDSNSVGPVYGFTRANYYLRSPDYNLQYYNPKNTYEPWPSTAKNSFSAASITGAKLDPGLKASGTVDLTVTNVLGLGNSNYPATFYAKLSAGTVERVHTYIEWDSCPSNYEVYKDTQCRKWELLSGYDYIPRPGTEKTAVDASKACSAVDSNWYTDWRQNPDSYRFKDQSGAVVERAGKGLAPDGICLDKIELVSGNEAEVLAATGESLAVQQQNFANWFEYYRRRHQIIRGAVAESVKDLENMNLGVFWLHNLRAMAGNMHDADDGLETFLDEHYGRFGSGTWSGGGTPNRAALQHAGQQYSSGTDVRGTLECRKNFTLHFTDGYSNQHPGSTYAGNADSTAKAPFGNSTYGDTLGDIAYYYAQGLRDSANAIIPGGKMRLPAKCGTSEQKDWMDCNEAFHMNTYTVGLGIKGAKYAGISHTTVADAHENHPDWSSIPDMNSTDNAAQIDDLYHAAVNGKGEYYDAKSAQDLVTALLSAVNKIKQETGSGSNVSFNTGSLAEGGRVYSARFTSGTWTGTVRAEAMGADGQVTSTLWDAAEKLDDRDLAADPRLILTYGVDEAGARTGTAFNWDSLTANQKADLSVDGGEDLARKRIDFLKGQPIETFGDIRFRKRSSLMGPVVNSSPEFVGAPAKKWPGIDPFGQEGDRYSAFRTSKSSRTGMVYAGASDGMLHGFNAETGREVLAYIPGFLFSEDNGKGLHYLTQQFYDYRSYVDLPVAVSDIYVGSSWRTIVISGARAGARGLFALDVTDPSTFSVANAANIALWEFTPADNANLGHLTSAVQVTLLDWGGGDYRWSAVFENGYGVNKSGVFVLDLSKARDAAWLEDTNYKFIELSGGDGLSPVRLVDYQTAAGGVGSDGMADRAYAGDRQGRLWAIDLTGGASNWGSVYGAQPLFVARDTGGNAQPITSRPVAAYNEYAKGNAQPNLIVLFGTGAYLNSDDLASNQLQSFYGINDRGEGSLNRSKLVSRELYEQTHPAVGVDVTVRKTDEGTMDWVTNYGWHVDFDTKTGERIVAPAQVKGNYVVFPTTIPASADPCGGGGSSFVMAIKLDGSTDTDRAILDVDGDGKLTALDDGWSGVSHGDAIINNTSLIGDLIIGSASDTGKPAFLTNLGSGPSSAKRASWREVLAQ